MSAAVSWLERGFAVLASLAGVVVLPGLGAAHDAGPGVTR